MIDSIISENEKRFSLLNKTYNPLTGEDAPGKRAVTELSDFLDGQTLYLPVEMLDEPFVRALILAGSIDAYAAKYYGVDDDGARESVYRRFVQLRCKHDFYFFAYAYARIKNKEGGEDIPFLLRRAQIKLVKEFEKDRLAGMPIRILLLKCRQWGGSTATDIYMAWIQIFWKTNWNSNIVGHQSTSASNVFAMYERLINAIPMWLFYPIGEEYDESRGKFAGVGTTQNIKKMVPRKCNIQTGSARNPESARSGDAAMAHITEEAFFPNTTEWTPQKVVNSAISSILPKPYTFIVRESTPNGRENEFHDEWQRTKKTYPSGVPMSAYRGVFVAWFEIETYVQEMSEGDIRTFAQWLYDNRDDSVYGGRYYWWLWKKGATLQGIKWYITKAAEYSDLDDMKQEFPSDDVEAFKFSGTTIFDDYKLEQLMEDCCTPIFVGDIEGDSEDCLNMAAMDNIRLYAKKNGELKVWDYPDTEVNVSDRYLVAVDIGGAHKTSDYHDIVVFDRYDLLFGGTEVVVAEWHGHCDPDRLALRCARMAAFYNDALLVVENNTAYSKMNNTDGDVSQLFFPILLPLYNNIYSARTASRAKKKKGKERTYGFNTNSSNKSAVVLHYCQKVRDLRYVEREQEALEECGYYMKYPNGQYGAAEGHHDDRLMARAIGLFVSEFDANKPMIHSNKSEEDILREKMRAATEVVPLEASGIT